MKRGYKIGSRKSEVGSGQWAVGSRERIKTYAHYSTITELRIAFIHILFNPAHCFLPTANFLLLTAYCPLPTAYSSPTTAYST